MELEELYPELIVPGFADEQGRVMLQPISLPLSGMLSPC